MSLWGFETLPEEEIDKATELFLCPYEGLKLDRVDNGLGLPILFLCPYEGLKLGLLISISPSDSRFYVPMRVWNPTRGGDR